MDEKDQAIAGLRKAQEVLKSLEDAQMILNGAKLQIYENEVEITRLAEALREATKRAESSSNNKID